MVTTNFHDDVRERMQRLIHDGGAAMPQTFTQALQSLLTAREYEDAALMRSALATALDEFHRFVEEAIETRLGYLSRVKKTCVDILQAIKGMPFETWDDIGNEFAVLFNDRQKEIEDVLSGPVNVLTRHGYKIAKAELLEQELRGFLELKKNVLDAWPWSHGELPPVDRAMVAASRSAISQNEGESRKDLFNRLGLSRAKS